MGELETIVTGVQDNTDAAATSATAATETTATETEKPEQSLIAGLTADEKPAENTEQSPDTKDSDKTTEETKPEYTDFTLPDGVPADKELMDGFKAYAKQLGLSQEQAQGLVDLQAKAIQASMTKQQAEVSAMQSGWLEESKKLLATPADRAAIAKARDQFATPEFVKLLDESKLGNHPELVRFFLAVGKAVSEDHYVPGGKGSAAAGLDARKLYPNSNMNP